ncbi:MAG: hypothetical protein JWM21_863 [Acidobacteria bacterium]|nr:hypothetical protein [Acidobacteriota bacterium]
MEEHATTIKSTVKGIRRHCKATSGQMFRSSLTVATRNLKNKCLVALIGSLLCLLAIACVGPVGPLKSSLDDEGVKKGEEYWYSTLTRCGTGYYVKDPSLDLIYQFNEVGIETTPSELTDGARQNGVEWRGVARLRSKTSRTRFGSHEWDPWRNGSVLPNGGVTVERVSGRWLFEGKEKPEPLLKPVDCSKVD